MYSRRRRRPGRRLITRWPRFLSVSSQDGTIVRNGYPLDLDALTEGNRVGLLRHADGSLHYYLDGLDQVRF